MDQVPSLEIYPSTDYVDYTADKTAIITNVPPSVDTNQDNSDTAPMIEAKKEVCYPITYCNGHFGYVQQGYLYITFHLTIILILFIITVYGFGYESINSIFSWICIGLFLIATVVYGYVKEHVKCVYFLYILVTFLPLNIVILSTPRGFKVDAIYGLMTLIIIVLTLTITLIIMGETIYKSILISEVFVVSGISFFIFFLNRKPEISAYIILPGFLYGLCAIIDTFAINKFHVKPGPTCVAVVMELYYDIFGQSIMIFLYVLAYIMPFFLKCMDDLFCKKR